MKYKCQSCIGHLGLQLCLEGFKMLYFEKLIVWQRAMDLSVYLVQIADSLPQKYQYSFSDQLRRAALSIPNNIAEGAGRKGKKDSANFYTISKGSAYESINIVILLEKLKLIDEERFNTKKIHEEAEEIVKMLHGLANSSLHPLA